MSQNDTIDFYSIESQFEKYAHVKTDLIFGDLSQPIPTYTILIPTYRRPELLEEAVLSALNQKKFQDYEILIVEHGQENDETEKMLKKYSKYKNIFYYKFSEWTLAGNWNKGAELVRTKWFTLLCDDDLLYPNYLYTVDNILKLNPHVDGIAPQHEYFYYDFETKKVIDDPKILCPAKTNWQIFLQKIKKRLLQEKYYMGSLMMDNFYVLTGAGNPSGVMYKKECFMSLGGWNIKFRGFGDLVLNANYIINYKMYYITEILAKRRFWDGAGSSLKDFRLEFIFWLKPFFEDLKNHLRILNYDEKYSKLLLCNALINEWDLEYKDVKDFNFDIPEKYYSKHYLTEFKKMRDEKMKKLAKSNPPLMKYSYSKFLKTMSVEKINAKKDIKGINNYVDFVEYFKQNKIQDRINYLSKKYKNKKIILYGGGLFTETLLNNYDLSPLNITAIADMQFSIFSELKGYSVINPESLKEISFDILLISTYRDDMILEFFKKKLFKGFKPNFKIESFIKRIP